MYDMEIEEKGVDLKPKCQEFSNIAKNWLVEGNVKEERMKDRKQSVVKVDPITVGVVSSFPCASCQYSFVKKKSLNFHIHKEHSDLLFRCNSCPKEFTNKKNLYCHVLRTHKGSETCPICQKNISTHNLKRHIGMKHENLYGKECLSCGKILTGSHFLNRHKEKFCGTNVKRKKGEIPCKLCHKKFVEKTLKHHIKSDHTIFLADGSSIVQTEPDNPCKARLCYCKEIVCTICLNSFKKERYLKMHITTVHQNTDSNGPWSIKLPKGRELLKCVKCDQEFQSNQSLQKHKREMHDGELVFDCNKCDAIFKTKGNQLSHNHNIHTPKVVCDKCSKKLTPGKLKRHMKWHTQQEVSINNELRHGPVTNVLPCTLNCLDPPNYHYHNPIVENIQYF